MRIAQDTNASTLLAAAQIWRLASRTFASEIDEPFYRALQGLAADPRLQATGLAPLDPGDMVEEEQVLPILAVEYCRLFIGPAPICPPYASLQRGSAPLGGQALHRLDAFLDKYGLVVRLPDDAPILAHDHVSVAFALLDQLYTTAAGHPATDLSSDDAAIAAQHLFGTCLLDWVPQFLHDVGSAARQTPYRNLSRLTAFAVDEMMITAPSQRQPDGGHSTAKATPIPTSTSNKTR